MQKRAQGQKVKINTKVAEVVSDKKKPNQAPKRPKVKDEIRLNKYIAILVLAHVVMLIFTFNRKRKVNGIPVVEMGYMVKPGDVVILTEQF
jgi:23S rRNA pseudouridine2605 synthase